MAKCSQHKTRPQGYGQYQITYFPPDDVWPIGGWSVCRITGDQIAQCIRYGKAVEYPFCIGTTNHIDGIKELIEADAKTVVTYVTNDKVETGL